MKMSEKSKTPPSGRTKKKNLSVRAFSSAEIELAYRKFCEFHSCSFIPNIVVCSEDQVHKLTVPNPKMFFIVRKANIQDPLEKVLCKNYVVDIGMILAMSDCFKHKMNPSTIKLETCSLTCTHMESLQMVLASTPSIKEVSVNGNPIEQQNHYLLLKDTHVTLLSMKFCGINGIGMDRICTEIRNSSNKNLLHLNLASNYLLDEGANHVANLLRTNRSLLSLNMADNKISYQGCIAIIGALMKFELNHEEIMERRRLRFDWYKKMKMEEDKAMLMLNLEKRETTGKSKSAKCSDTPMNKTPKASINESEYNPLIQDSYEENSEVYCIGNHFLINLNLSYNRITNNAVNSLIEMLNYQIEFFANDQGLSRISLQGNRLPVDVLDNIGSILMRKRQTNQSFRMKIKSVNLERKKPTSIINTI